MIVGLLYLPLASYCPYPIVDTELSTRKSHDTQPVRFSAQVARLGPGSALIFCTYEQVGEMDPGGSWWYEWL